MNNPSALLEQGEKALHSGDGVTALAFFEQALRNDGEFFRCQFLIGSAREACGEDGKAIESWTRALQVKELTCEHAMTFSKMAIATVRQGELVEGIFLLQQALVLDPEQETFLALLSEWNGRLVPERADPQPLYYA